METSVRHESIVSWGTGLLIMVLAVFSFPRVLLPYDGHGLDPSWTIGLDEAAQRRSSSAATWDLLTGHLAQFSTPCARVMPYQLHYQ